MLYFIATFFNQIIFGGDVALTSVSSYVVIEDCFNYWASWLKWLLSVFSRGDALETMGIDSTFAFNFPYFNQSMGISFVDFGNVVCYTLAFVFVLIIGITLFKLLKKLLSFGVLD